MSSSFLYIYPNSNSNCTFLFIRSSTHHSNRLAIIINVISNGQGSGGDNGDDNENGDNTNNNDDTDDDDNDDDDDGNDDDDDNDDGDDDDNADDDDVHVQLLAISKKTG